MGGRLPNDFLVWLEVIINETSKPWLACELSQYNYFEYLTRLLYQQGLSEDEVDSIKLWAVDYPLNHPMCGHWVLPPSRFVIQNDDHDQQAGKKGLR
jgi:alpha-amylase